MSIFFHNDISFSFFIIIFGAVFTLLHGIEQITGKRHRTHHDYLTSIVMIIVSIILYNHGVIIIEGPKKDIPLIFYLTSVYCIGPLNYFYYCSLINNSLPLPFYSFIHLFPAFLIFIYEIILYLNPNLLTSTIAAFYSKFINCFGILLIIGGIIFISYQLYFIYNCIKIFHNAKLRKGLCLTLLLECINIATPLPILLWLITKQHYFYAIAGFMTTSVIITLFLTHRRFPFLFQNIADAIRTKKYERNYLSNVDTENLHKQLLHIMKNEKLYLDPELNLERLSNKLNITPHQLSQLLNEHYKIRFNHFVNKFRIEEAKIILEKNPDANILSVAYHVGFNSKSNFNKIFKQYTGTTPTAYKYSIHKYAHNRIY